MRRTKKNIKGKTVSMMVLLLITFFFPMSFRTIPKQMKEQKLPNILWICTDQQRWNTIHSLGNPYIKTPNIDRIVKSGVSFTNAFCQVPACTPSRASFLTGMYPSTVHDCMNGTDHWPEAAPLVTKLLKDAGYDCGLSGKLHLSTAQGHNPEQRPKDDGYREFWFSHSPHQGGDKNQYLVWLKKQGYTYKQVKAMPGKRQAALHQTTWCTNKAIDFIKEKREGPWEFSLNIFDPHPPFDPPQSYVERFDIPNLPGPLFRKSDMVQQTKLSDIMFQSVPEDPAKFDGKLLQAKYWAQIELIDENVGRLLNTLKETGQLENTIIIYSSDHGDMLGDHGLRYKGCRFYEGLIHVPLIFSWPGHFQGNLQADALVELIDIAPTLLEVAGVKIPERMEGKSLLPILTGKADPHHHREFVRSTFYNSLRNKKGAPSYATMIRTKNSKLVVYHGHNKGELYDLVRDPGEFTNLWNDPAYINIKLDLVIKDFNATVYAIDTGPKRIGRY